jgi:hypothetical protein
MSTERIRILVTGGCGFLGTEIVSALLATQRYEITAIDINPPALGTTTFTQDVRYVRANVLDRDALQKVFDEAKPAMVVHTVGVYRLGTARYSTRNKEGEFTVNVEGTRNVLEASKECGAKGMVYTSSVTVVLDELGKDFKNVDEEWPTGRAKTTYGQSKVGKLVPFWLHMPQPWLSLDDSSCLLPLCNRVSMDRADPNIRRHRQASMSPPAQLPSTCLYLLPSLLVLSCSHQPRTLTVADPSRLSPKTSCSQPPPRTAHSRPARCAAPQSSAPPTQP